MMFTQLETILMCLLCTWIGVTIGMIPWGKANDHPPSDGGDKFGF